MVERSTRLADAIRQFEVGTESKIVAAISHKLYFFDLAGFPFLDQLHGLLRLVNSRRIICSSDHPYTSIPSVIEIGGRSPRAIAKAFG